MDRSSRKTIIDYASKNLNIHNKAQDFKSFKLDESCAFRI